jgi:hypothetical protein
MAGINPRGVTNSGSNAPQGQSVGRTGKGWGITAFNGGGAGWSPTVSYLLILVVLEFFAYAALRYTFRSVHGG